MMDEETLEALKGSIEKWQDIVDGTGADLGVNNCPLCHLFHDNDCDGCPVSERSGARYCDNTPYQEWWMIKAQGSTREDPDIHKGIATSSIAKDLARSELEFLISLLPESP